MTIRYALVCLALLSTTCCGQYLQFSNDTDTVSVAGNTVVSADMTIEARVWLIGNGTVFNEWQFAAEDKYIVVGSSNAFAFPHVGTALNGGATPFAGWLHLAFVVDSSASTESIYLNGVRTGTRTASGAIANASSSVAHVGSIFRGGGTAQPGMRGFIDTLRVSDVARYSGASFTPPVGDLSSDASTLLLYNFNEAPGSTTVADLSGNGRTGTLGAGFSGASSPVFTGSLPSGQPNSPGASLLVNGAGATGSGPFSVTLTTPGSLGFSWSGSSNRPYLLFAGPLNPGGAGFSGIGSLDIGTAPSFGDVSVLFNGLAGPLAPLFMLDATGNAQQNFSLGGLSPGLLFNVQGMVYQAAGAPSPVVLTAAFQIIS